MAANIGPSGPPLPANVPIELQFDRLLQPISITRQTFVLENANQNVGYMPSVAYDPVSRVVTITPLGDPGQALQPQQTYKLVITTPMNASDPNGLRAIDGAPLEAPSQRVIAFTVGNPTPTPPVPVSIDFCRDVYPTFQDNCAFGNCHGSALTAADGLLLLPPSELLATAIGRVSIGANTGPQSQAGPPTMLFGEDMPIVDSTGNPSNSWMMYKLLLAVPMPEPVVPDAGSGAEPGTPDAAAEASNTAAPDATTVEAGASDDAGTAEDGGLSDAALSDAAPEASVTATPTAPQPVDVSNVHAFPTVAISSAERMTLSNYILGREMPYVSNTPSTTGIGELTLDQMERISLWIAQGAQVSPTCR